jgi:hypothetical protein
LCENREHCPVTDFKLLEDVMKMHSDEVVALIPLFDNPWDTKRAICRSRSVRAVSELFVIAMSFSNPVIMQGLYRRLQFARKPTVDTAVGLSYS